MSVIEKYGCISHARPMLKRCRNCRYKNDTSSCLKHVEQDNYKIILYAMKVEPEEI